MKPDTAIPSPEPTPPEQHRAQWRSRARQRDRSHAQPQERPRRGEHGEDPPLDRREHGAPLVLAQGTAPARFNACSVRFSLRFQAVQSGSLNLFMGWARRRRWFTHVQRAQTMLSTRSAFWGGTPKHRLGDMSALIFPSVSASWFSGRLIFVVGARCKGRQLGLEPQDTHLPLSGIPML
jgi:hypothetical protein